jgi:prolyl-tRNA synthetase
MGGSQSEEFLCPSEIGEDVYVKAPSGYAANVEAVSTLVPQDIPEQEIAKLPSPEVIATPNADSIEMLISIVNKVYPNKNEQDWQVSDALKHVIFRLDWEGNHESKLLVLALPGDRQISLQRLEAAVYPAMPTQATEDDLAKFPEIIPNYLGPELFDEDFCKKYKDKVQYAVDPRVVKGTSWISGSNKKGYHTFNLVMGRDFYTENVLDVAEIKSGDPASDGSGALTLEKGIEIAHIFALGQKYSKALDLMVTDESGKLINVSMGSYGIGVSRVLATLAELNNDEKGLAWPIAVAPAHVHIVVLNKEDSAYKFAQDISEQLSERSIEVIIDDRKKASAGVKFNDAELLGVPFILVIGKNAIELRNRDGSNMEKLDRDQIISKIQERLL